MGNDLVQLSEFRASFNELFKQKVFTTAEQAYCEQFSDPLLRYAATWAAKEAVYKAIKQWEPAVPMGWKTIEITRQRIGGKPEAVLHKHPGKFTLSLSISHDGDYAWAIALAGRTP